MSATWYDIKLRTIQKMFAHKGNDIPQDTSTNDYVAAMPGACNEALQTLSTVGKFIIKSIQIAHNPIKNLLNNGARIWSSEGGTIEISASGARSLFAEVLGSVTATIYVDGNAVESETISSKTYYSPFRKLISSTSTQMVTVKFVSDYPFAIKNYALYGATFESVDDVPTFAEVVKYDLTQFAPSFFQLADDPIRYEGEYSERYMETTSYFEEGGRILVLYRDKPGNYTIYYKAYPQKITSSTPDDYVLEIAPEVEALLPLYMASQLYKDDDNSIAIDYLNMFETGLSRLQDATREPSSAELTSESGWT